MKVSFEPDELYPFYTIDEDNEYTAIELTEEEIADYKEVSARFGAWQRKIEEMVQAAREGDRTS